MITPETALQTLQQAFTNGRLSPVWLLTGPRAGEVAHQFAETVLGEVAHRQIRAGTYPNLYDLVVAKETGIEDVRLLLNYLQQSAPLPGWRVVMIENMDLLNRNGANALLKTLEEPPLLTLLLMTAQNQAKVLPTIRSRCMRLNLMSSMLTETDDQEMRTVLLAAAQGNFQPVVAFVEKTAADEEGFTQSLDFLMQSLYRLIKQAYQEGVLVQKPLPHWLAAQEAIAHFVHEAGAARLDRKHMLMACFVLIENPELLHV